MNERIQKLADQAQQYAEYNTPQGLEWLPMFKERFAELIVRTCIAKCDDLNSMKYIADHFGVKVQGLE